MAKLHFGFALALAGLVIAPAFALAQQQGIGEVASLRKVAARSGTPLSLGAGVLQNDVVTTGNDSSVRIAFVDQTNLAIGANSRVMLDKFVYNPGSQAMVVNLGRGAFRFTSGNLPKTSYRIETPTATMGVRGTVINIDIGPNGASTFTSFEGSATVCSKITGQCQDINPGETVQVDARGNITRIQTQFTFEDYCARNATLCEGVTRRAAAPWSNPEMVLLGATGVGALAAGLIALTDNDNDPVSP